MYHQQRKPSSYYGRQDNAPPHRSGGKRSYSSYLRDDQPWAAAASRIGEDYQHPKLNKYSLHSDVNYDDYIELDEYDLALLGVNPNFERFRRPLPVQDVNQFPDKKPHPHLLQCEHPKIMTRPVDYEQRILNQQTAERKVYKPSTRDELKTVLHWGQRKLLMSEIEFLTEYGEDGCLVLYAGAAPGTHTNYLSKLFPTFKFVLVDPSEFICRETDKIQIRQEYFTDEVAKEYANKEVLFISDIRRADPKQQSFQEVEKLVKEDMEMQLKWHKILKPKWSMLKFRLPYMPGKTTYLDGKIYLPVWGRQRTSECRLVCSGDARMKVYDNTEYEEHLYFFNIVTRASWYPYPEEIQVPGMDHCFDCASEIYILKTYLEKFKFTDGVEESELNKAITAMAIEINTECDTRGGGRSLENTPARVKDQFLPKHHVDASRLTTGLDSDL